LSSAFRLLFSEGKLKLELALPEKSSAVGFLCESLCAPCLCGWYSSARNKPRRHREHRVAQRRRLFGQSRL